MRHLFIQFLTNINGKKRIIYWSKKFGIQPLFISIWFKIDPVVCDRLNITVTYHQLTFCEYKKSIKMPIIYFSLSLSLFPFLALPLSSSTFSLSRPNSVSIFHCINSLSLFLGLSFHLSVSISVHTMSTNHLFFPLFFHFFYLGLKLERLSLSYNFNLVQHLWVRWTS